MKNSTGVSTLLYNDFLLQISTSGFYGITAVDKTIPKPNPISIRAHDSSKVVCFSNNNMWISYAMIYASLFYLQSTQEPWTNHIPVQIIRNQEINVWTYPSMHVYKIYIPSKHVFKTCSPLFPVIENMGHLGMIWWHLKWGKCHNLKNICDSDKIQNGFYHFIHKVTIWAKTNLVHLYIFAHFRPLWYLKKEWTNLLIFLFSNPPSLLIIFL